MPPTGLKTNSRISTGDPLPNSLTRGRPSPPPAPSPPAKALEGRGGQAAWRFSVGWVKRALPRNPPPSMGGIAKQPDLCARSPTFASLRLCVHFFCVHFFQETVAEGMSGGFEWGSKRGGCTLRASDALRDAHPVVRIAHQSETRELGTQFPDPLDPLDMPHMVLRHRPLPTYQSLVSRSTTDPKQFRYLAKCEFQ